MTIADLGAHYDVFEEIDGVRHHVGVSFMREALLSEDAAAFRGRIERLASRLRGTGLNVATRYLSGPARLATIEVRLEATPAPLEIRRARGKRSGARHAA